MVVLEHGRFPDNNRLCYAGGNGGADYAFIINAVPSLTLYSIAASGAIADGSVARWLPVSPVTAHQHFGDGY